MTIVNRKELGREHPAFLQLFIQTLTIMTKHQFLKSFYSGVINPLVKAF